MLSGGFVEDDVRNCHVKIQGLRPRAATWHFLSATNHFTVASWSWEIFENAVEILKDCASIS